MANDNAGVSWNTLERQQRCGTDLISQLIPYSPVQFWALVALDELCGPQKSD